MRAVVEVSANILWHMVEKVKVGLLWARPGTGVGVQGRLPGFKCHLCYTPGVWLWASHFTLQSFNFLIYKTGIIIVLMSESYFKDSGTSACKMFSVVPET